MESEKNCNVFYVVSNSEFNVTIRSYDMTVQLHKMYYVQKILY